MTCDLVTNRILSSLMRKVCSSNINLQLLWYIFLPLKITFYQLNTISTSRELVSTSWEISNCYLLPDKYTFPISGELAFPSWEISISTIYQINTFFHFWGTSYFHFWGTDLWPSHQPIFELSYEESLLFQHKSTAPMIYILTFENNLLPGKYFSHFWENRFHLLGNLKITLYQINTFFHFWGTSCFLFWEMTCDLVTNRFLELSYEESLLFSHKSTAPMIYILTLGNNLWNFTSGKINYTASVFGFFWLCLTIYNIVHICIANIYHRFSFANNSESNAVFSFNTLTLAFNDYAFKTTDPFSKVNDSFLF